MAIAYINKTIPIKNVTATRGSLVIRADRSWTAGNIQRQDLSGDNPILEVWNLNAKYNSRTEFESIASYLKSCLFSTVDFWIDSFGGTPETNSKKARIDPIEYDRVAFQNGSTWENNGRSFSIKIQEVAQ